MRLTNGVWSLEGTDEEVEMDVDMEVVEEVEGFLWLCFLVFCSFLELGGVWVRVAGGGGGGGGAMGGGGPLSESTLNRSTAANAVCVGAGCFLVALGSTAGPCRATPVDTTALYGRTLPFSRDFTTSTLVGCDPESTEDVFDDFFLGLGTENGVEEDSCCCLPSLAAVECCDLPSPFPCCLPPFSPRSLSFTGTGGCATACRSCEEAVEEERVAAEELLLLVSAAEMVET